MRSLAGFILRGKTQAVAVTVVCAFLALLMTPFSLLSGAAVALVTLRIGPRQGVEVMAWATLATALLGVPVLGSPLLGPVFLVMLWLPVYLLAVSLRRTVSLGRSVILAGLFGGMMVLGVYGVNSDPAAWWQQVLGELLAQLDPANAEFESLRQMVPEIARYMTAALAAGLSMNLLACLLLARWWQAALFNPGGFRGEFHRLQLGRETSVAALVLVTVAALVGDGVAGAIGRDLAFVALVLLLIQGLAVVHGLAARVKAGFGWLIGVYLLTLLVPFESALVLILLGGSDNFFDFRSFFSGREE